MFICASMNYSQRSLVRHRMRYVKICLVANESRDCVQHRKMITNPAIAVDILESENKVS